MDKVKIALAVLKKHHFWVLCGLVLVISLVAWWKATGSLADQFTTRKTKLDGYFGQMAGIAAEPNHANEQVIKVIGKETEEAKGKVLALWKRLYEEQKAKNELPRTLTENFRTFFRSLEKGEIDDLPREYRYEYWQFIPQHFTVLFEEELNVLRPRKRPEDESAPSRSPRSASLGADTERKNGSTSSGGEKGSRGSRQADGSQGRSGTEMIGVVAWDQTDRDTLKGRFQWPTVPTTEQVRNAQEDLWVIEALVGVIKRTNEGATGQYNAPVKEILALQIGAEAVHETTVMRTESGHPGPESGNGRYVDEDGEPLAPGEESSFAEFKMMPVSLVLRMDQTNIPRLLVECANSDMPIEVRSVQLRPGKGTPLDLSHLAAAAGAAGETDDSGHARIQGRSGSSRAGLQITGTKPTDSLDIPVEIHGIICIYNPPDEDKLGTGTATAKPAATPATPGAPQPTPAPAEPAPAGQPAPAET